MQQISKMTKSKKCSIKVGSLVSQTPLKNSVSGDSRPHRSSAHTRIAAVKPKIVKCGRAKVSPNV